MPDQIIKLAIWDYPPAEFLVFGFTSGAVPSSIAIERHDPLTCLRRFQAGEVDIALLPSLSVLRDHDNMLVIPDIGLSSKSYPYARLFLKTGLDSLKSVAFDPRFAQEILMTRSVLREHYRTQPEFVPLQSAELSALEQYDAVLAVGADVPMLKSEHLSLDLGQEWFELMAFPMVWGVFVGKTKELTVELAKTMQEAVKKSEERYDVWAQSQESPQVIRSFFDHSFRSRLDTYALEGLDHFAQHLFFLGTLTEVPTLPFIHIPDPKEEADTDKPKGRR